ncbi:YafY family protein [Streptomyces sp. NPDC097981]|uniref:helix-turn-helix transcriptional regulator n=1 Tax=Streptomyces sp. NPDC097981 TaxID=3155428 RepID=UPI00332B30DE
MTQDLPARMLRLLSLLQTRRAWTGGELADRLGVTLRTIRRDIDRLRELGYPVESTTGRTGGYRLAAGADLPPLLLDDEEAVAIATALRTATSGVSGIAESAVRALAKLEQVLPARLRHQVAAIHAATTTVPWDRGPGADPSALAVLAAACRDHEIVTFTYPSRSGGTAPRRVEPHSLVVAGTRWYLIAYDTDRTDWRTFRVDRLTYPVPTGHRVTPRELPATDPIAFLAARVAAAPARYTLSVTVPADAATVLDHTQVLPERVRSVGAHTSTIELAADAPRRIALQLFDLAPGPGSTFQGSPELAPHLKEFAQLLQDVARALTTSEPDEPHTPTTQDH